MFAELNSTQTTSVLVFSLLVLAVTVLSIVSALSERSKREYEAYMRYLDLRAKGLIDYDASPYEKVRVDPITEVRIPRPGVASESAQVRPRPIRDNPQA